MILYLSTTTTTTISDLVDSDGNPYTFTHPITNFNLTNIWLPEELLASTGLQSAINAGTIIVTKDGNNTPIPNITTAFNVSGGSGGSTRATRQIAVSTNILATDDIIEFTGSTGQILTLPDPTPITGKTITIKNSSAFIVEIASVAVIDGYSSVFITSENPSMSFVSDGTKWFSIDFSGYETGATGNMMAPYNSSVITGSDLGNSHKKFFVYDSTRAKSLSIEQTTLTFGRNNLGTNTWLKILGDFSDGYVMPYNGTIIASALSCGDTKNQTRNISIYVGNIENTALHTINGIGYQTNVNSSVNIDFTAGDRIRMQGRGPGSKIEHVSVVLWVKWRN